MERTSAARQSHPNEVFEAKGFCSLCKRIVSRCFPKRVVVSDEDISRIMDQENVQFDPSPHVHVYWIDRNLSVRKVEGIRIRDDGLKAQTWVLDELSRPRREGNVIILGSNFTSSFNNIAGFLVRSRNTIIEAMPRSFDDSLITKHSADQDITVSVLPTPNSDISNLSEWIKLLVRSIGNSQTDTDSNSVWLALSYGDVNAGRSPVSVDEKILVILLLSKHLIATLRPEVKSLIMSFSNELNVDLTSIEPSFSLKSLYDETEDMIKRVGVCTTFKVFFKLFNSRMLRIEQLAHPDAPN